MGLRWPTRKSVLCLTAVQAPRGSWAVHRHASGVFCLPHTALSRGTAEAQPRDIGSEVDRGWGGGGAFISPR